MRNGIIYAIQSNFLKTTSRMVSVGTLLAIVGVIAVIVLLYMWPEIFGRNRTEYFTDTAAEAPPPAEAAPAAAQQKLPIESMNSASLLPAIAVPHIKSLEGFQSGSVHTSFDDGNGQVDSYAGSSNVVGSGYNIQPMDNSAMSGTAAGAGAPSRLTTYTPPLANVIMSSGPLAGSAAGAGFLLLGEVVPTVGYTSVNTPSPIVNGRPSAPPPPPEPTMNLPVLNSGMIKIGDVRTGSYATEDPTSTPSFTVAASQLDPNAVNTVKTNLASGGQYMLNVTCDLPNIQYSFPLEEIQNVANSQNQVYAYSFLNYTVQKPGLVFFGAKMLNFQIVQTEPLPETSPNAPPLPPPGPPSIPSSVLSATSINNNSSGTAGSVGTSMVSPFTSSAPIAQSASEVSAQMLNTLAGKLITTLLANETDPSIQVGLTTALQNVPTTGSSIPNPGYINMYNAVAAIPTNFTYTQLANMYNTLPSTTGATRPVPNPTNVLLMAPVVGGSLQNTRGQVNTSQGQTVSRWDTQPAQQPLLQQQQRFSTPPAHTSNIWAPTPPNAISSEPPSTMASVLPATAQVSPINNYTFTNQSVMLDAGDLAQKIRSAEMMVQCNNYSPLMPPVRGSNQARNVTTAPTFTLTNDSMGKIGAAMVAYYKSKGFNLADSSAPKPTPDQVRGLTEGLIAYLVTRGLIPSGLTMEQFVAAQQLLQKQNAINEAKANDKRIRAAAVAADPTSKLFIDTNGLAIGYVTASKNGTCSGENNPAATVAYAQCTAAMHK